MRRSLLPPAGGNLFQGIKALCKEQESKGMRLIKLTIGEPSGPAFEEACRAAAEAIMSRDSDMHGYQDNGEQGCPGFSARFIARHVQTSVHTLIGSGMADVLPIPGIKPMLGPVIQSSGCWLPNGRNRLIATLTEPGYPTPADQCAMIRGAVHRTLPTGPQNGFRFTVEDLVALDLREGDMIMVNFPVNPTGVIATREWYRPILQYCSDKGIRIFSDAAYAILMNNPEACLLTEIAPEFPDLNWVEAFSASKAGNFTGWRIGAMIGSPEFIGDVKRIKGNTDSGFNAALATGVLHLFENHPERIAEVKKLYADRLDVLMEVMEKAGMKLAVKPEAGFFALYLTPRQAFGVEVKDAVHFNNLMIENTGLVGVPFRGYMRYTVAPEDVVSLRDEITLAINKAKVSY